MQATAQDPLEVRIANTTPKDLLIAIVQYGGYAHDFFREHSVSHGIEFEKDRSAICEQYLQGGVRVSPFPPVMRVTPLGNDRYRVQFLTDVNWPDGKSMDTFLAEHVPQ